MRRILMVLAVAAFMVAMMATAVPAFAAAPNGGCPTGFEQGLPDLGSNSNGIPSASVNTSPTICTKDLTAKPQAPQFCCDPVITVFRDDTVGGPK